MVELLTAAIATGAGDKIQNKFTEKTYQARGTTSAGSGSATIDIEVCNFDNPVDADWVTLATITLTLGTTSTNDGQYAVSSWRYSRANVTAISGTDASVDVVMHEGEDR